LDQTPQVWPSCAHVSGVQLPDPQSPGVPPPPQVCVPEHIPQLRMAPQPSDQDPQLWPSCMHVVGVQLEPAQWPPVLHTCVPGHVPQLGMMPPQPFGAGPH
jgi:hypothetical protein